MFGIDISTHQAGIDLVRAKSEGVEFVIVKAVAAYRPELTVADSYHANIDATIAAGLAKGHYLVPNSRNTPEAAAKFYAENVYRYSGGDVLALDNEPLDGYPVFWKDADVARFFRALHAELGHPYERMWLYCPASLTRSNGPLTETIALGVKIWWVSYGAGGNNTQKPDHYPLLGGGIPYWHVHQFSSDVDVAGLPRVDGNYSRESVTNLFGGSEMGYLEVRPARGNINTPFGPRPKPTPTSPAIHYGQDYGWGGGDAIFAARSGIVLEYANVGAYGNRLVLEHGNNRRTWYCHLASATVPVGTAVSAGQQIAWMGATGNVTAKHLHFELRVNGVATDPEPYFASGSTAGGGTTPIEEIDMPLTPDDIHKVATYLLSYPAYTDGPSVSQALKDIRNDSSNNFHAMFTGGPSMQDGGKPVSQSLAEINGKPAAVVSVDVDELAAKIAGRIVIPEGSAATAAEIAAAVRAEFKANPLS